MRGEQNMTEAPKAGFLCTGKTPLELAISIHCQSKMDTILKNAGYNIGGCYTEILDNSGPEKIKRAGKTMEYLCRSNDVVFTLGCEGFAPGDVIPELTDVVCTGNASYFTSILCGAQELVLPSERTSQPGLWGNACRISDCERIYSGDSQETAKNGTIGEFRPRTRKSESAMPFAERLRKALKQLNNDNLPPEKAHAAESLHTRMTAGSAMRIFAGLRDRTAVWGTEETVPENRNLKEEKGRFGKTSEYSARGRTTIKAPLSRAHAGLLGNAVLLNFSNDIGTALPLLKGLLPAIGFSVYNLSGKSAASYAEFEKSLKNAAGIGESLELRRAVNN